MERRAPRRARGAAHAKTAGVFGVAAALSLAPNAAYADEAPPPVAPPGSSSASVLTIDDLLAVSKTRADASGAGSSASAGVVVLNGSPVLGTGGTQKGAGSSGGSLLDTGATPVGRVIVAPWTAEVTEGSESTARGRAAALEAYVVNEGFLSIVLLDSESKAKHSGSNSSGSASSDAARLKALGLVDVTVLHSESSSENGSRSYIVKVNGTEIGSSEQVGSICSLALPNLVTVGCLSASGGTAADGTTTGGASVASAGVVPVGADATAFGVGQSGGQAPVGQAQGGTRGPGSGPGGGSGGPGSGGSGGGDTKSAAPSGPSGALPTTGSSAARTGALAAFALAAGAWMQTAGRLRRRGFTA